MFKNLKIGSKLLAAFSIVMVLFVIVLGIAIVNINKISSQMDVFYDSAYTSNILVWEARRDIRRLEGNVYKALSIDDTVITNAAIEQANQSAIDFTASLEKLKVSYPIMEAEIDQALAIASSAKGDREQIIDLASQNRNVEAFDIMTNTYMPELEKVIAIVETVGNSAEADAQKFVTDSAKTSNQTMIIMIIAGVIILLLIIVLTRLITKSIATPAQKIAQRISLLVKGDLKSPMPIIEGKDEIGDLAASATELVEGLGLMINDTSRVLNEMAIGNFTVKCIDREFPGDFLPLQTATKQIIASLSDTLSQINNASEQVASGSEQVSDGAQSLAQGASEQASSVEQLSASIAEISDQIKRNAEISIRAKEMSDKSTTSIVTSNSEMQKLMVAMGDINDKSGQIGKIIKSIEDIAFQTNILALNAAVEAARAGAAGKGFAVVADEVRNLAGKSAEAAKNTTELIENSIAAVEVGTKLADETAKELLSIVDVVGQTSSLIGEVTVSSNQQATAIAQVDLGVGQIASVVQTNSATSEQSAAAAEELSSQAELMRSLVGRFKLEQNSVGAAQSAHFSSDPAPQQINQDYHYEYESNGGKY